jgi:rod shape-determining protein MreD
MTQVVLKWIGLFALCFVLQSTLVQAMKIVSVGPDLLMLALFFLGIAYGPLAGLYVGFFLGLSQDLYSPSILGLNALSNTVTGFFIGLFNERMMRTDPLLKAIILMMAFILHDSIFSIAQVLKTSGSFGHAGIDLLVRTIPRGMYSAALLGLYYIYDFYFKPSIRR